MDSARCAEPAVILQGDVHNLEHPADHPDGGPLAHDRLSGPTFAPRRPSHDERVQDEQKSRLESRLKPPRHPKELGVEEDPDADHHQIGRDDE